MKHSSKAFLTCLFISSLFSCKSEQKKAYQTPEKAPNVLLIIADDLGAHDLSTTQSNYYETPNIDQIAANGIQFDQGYASCQVCSPSRASIMSGKSPARHGITDWIGAAEGEKWRKQKRHNKLLPAFYEHQLDTSYITMPEAFKEHGYTTFFAGKWHVGGQGSLPEDHGFDINKGGFHAGSPRGGYFSPYKNPKLEDGPEGENLSMRLANETVEFMANHKDKPFFACLSFYAVHGPIQTTEEKWRKYRDKAVANGIEEEGYEMGKFMPIRQYQDNPVYAGLVESMDDAVGRVMNSLKELGLDENTIVVFTGDNGGVSAGDAFSTSNLPLKGGKGYQFEGGLRTPYIIKVPWLKHQKKRSDVPVTHTDFYPTLLELSGLPLYPDQHQDGISLAPLFHDETVENRSIVWHYPHYGNQGGEPSSVIRSGKWKLIHYYEDNREELYNLELDEQEAHNLATEYPNIVKNLSDSLFTYLNELGAKYPEKDDTWTLAKEEAHLNKVKMKKMPALEKKRMEMLGDDFKPNDDWWGSQRIID
ncbi:sulfatase [Flammeovirga sp. MY04]|uniref:sulfatase n=1 Tax=Flammeovirga sp. MY04 TaxID=1191459 RepID=UPI0008062108|nr:sulfatase [Flammeovirga sp. MY04]ANQ52459.1 sulfatase [Flammeovirga sp. MY04]